jgi:hypothetical protein
MRQILSLLLITGLLSSLVSPIWALTPLESSATVTPPPAIVYPAGDDFVRLQWLIETNFAPKRYQYNCIMNDTLCPTYRYTSVIERAIKLIIMKTYVGNEVFYATKFGNSSLTKDELESIIAHRDSPWSAKIPSMSDILRGIPSGTSLAPWSSRMFGGSISGDLLDASFGLDFTENANSSTMLGAIASKIKDLKISKCQRANSNGDSYTLCPWNGDISNEYLPTLDELLTEDIYLDRTSVKIASIKDEFEYNIQKHIEPKNTIDSSGAILTNYIRVSSGYTLRYKKDSYTLEEAKTKLEEKTQNSGSFVITSATKLPPQELPCNQIASTQRSIDAYTTRGKCTAVAANLKEVQTALAAYNIDTMKYPTDIMELSRAYLPKFPQNFTDNFSYKTTTNTQGQPDFEIRYIGHIGEWQTDNTTPLKKDYKAMLSGATVPEIPAIFAHVPADSMVLYVRNPANLLDILSAKSDTTARLSGIDVSESIRGFVQTFFELQNFEKIEKNLKHEMAVVVNDLDATAPDIVIILSESDRDALAPTAKARVVGSRDGYIYIASSKVSLDHVMGLQSAQSMRDAPDFQYVWTKKSALVKDALVFVGDEFFEKILSLETYITHYRKYRDYHRLSSLQELVWAYGDAYGRAPTSLGEFWLLGLSSLTGSVLGEYSIVDGLVSHRSIGTLRAPLTIPEARYDLSTITRSELEDYQYNILGYRDMWRSSLDPMGIVINRYGDGMEIDFFMTPIPSVSQWSELGNMQRFFETTTKDSLSFVTNPRIRMGLASLAWGWDVDRLKSKIQWDEMVGREFDSWNRNMMGDKNILDYIGGEFALTLGGVDPDIFEGYNIEKIDAHIAVQFKSEEKGKEFIELIKKQFTSQLGGTEGMFAKVLAKPIIEDYAGKKIYYTEDIPVPFAGKIGFAYTFVDDFLIVGLNRPTIRRVIDTAATGDKNKLNIVDASTLEKGTFVTMLFDGVRTSQELSQLYRSNKPSIAWIFDNTYTIPMGPLLSSYYVSGDRARRLGQEVPVIDYRVGAISFSGTGGSLRVAIDEQGLSTLSGATLEKWNTLKSDATFPKEILSTSGIPLDMFLYLERQVDILAVVLIAHLDRTIDGADTLLRNMTLGLSMGDDEIGFRVRMWRERDPAAASTLGSFTGWMTPAVTWIVVWIVGILILVGIVTMVVISRRRTISPVSISVPVPAPATVVTDIIPESVVAPVVSDSTSTPSL